MTEKLKNASEGLIDNGLLIDWSNTSHDYAEFRPGPPPSFYKKLQALDIGLPSQHILDLGTGTGVLARQFAKQGAVVSGIDISAGQIEQARSLAKQDHLVVDFRISSAENTPFADHRFDIIAANQCWLYFDKDKAIAEVKRLLRKEGVLFVSHFNWLPLADPIAKASEELILKYNPHWQAHGYDGRVLPIPTWAETDFNLVGMFCYEEAIQFSRESWRGRIRACRGTGAVLSKEVLQQFDEEHDHLLKELAGEHFSILHQIRAHILKPKLCA